MLHRFDSAGALLLLQAGAHDGILKCALGFKAYLVGNGEVLNFDRQIFWHDQWRLRYG